MIRIFMLVALFGGGLMAATESLPPVIVCAVGFVRPVEVACPGHDLAGGVSVRMTPPDFAVITTEQVSAHQVRLFLEAKHDGGATLELLDVRQTVVARRSLQVVALNTTAETGIGSEGSTPDGFIVFHGDLVLTPYVAGLDIRFVCLGKGVIMPDGARDWWYRSDSMTRTPATGGARMSFRMLRPQKERWVPFTYIVYQDGVQITEE